MNQIIWNSLATKINLRFLLALHQQALVVRSLDIPFAILPIVPIEAGQTIMIL